jgi:hypothetical protein
MDAPAGEHLDRAVVHPDRDGDLEHPARLAQEPVNVRIELGQCGCIVQSLEDGIPRTHAHVRFSLADALRDRPPVDR